jgi:PEGA domain
MVNNIKTGVIMRASRNFSKIVMVIVLLGVLTCFWHFAFAAGDKKVAVLELLNKAGVTEDEAYALTDQVRIVASESLPGAHFTIMTSENIEELLPPDMDLAKCTDAKCEVEMGRMIGAEYLITGEIIRFAGDLRINLKVHNSRTGSFVGGRNCEATEIRGLENKLKGSAQQLFSLVISYAGVSAPASSGGGVVFVSPTQPTAPGGAAEVRALAPTEQPPATATGPAGLFITSKPKGADVYLGQTKAGTTNIAFQKVNLQAGTNVRVTLKMDLYHDLSFDVALKSGVMKFEGVELKPAFGSLKIESEPSGAEVSIGGSKVGTTPFSKSRYASGQYLVTVKKEWYLPQEDQQIIVSDGQATNKMFTLSQDFGTLDVQSNPSGAEVTLDGKKLGLTPGSWRVPPVKNGKVEVSLTKHRGKSFEITIDRDQTVKIGADQATLTKKTGVLQVYTDPPVQNAEVYLNDILVGVTPMSLNDVLVGSYKLSVTTAKKGGGEDIVINEGKSLTSVVKLFDKGGPEMLTDRLVSQNGKIIIVIAPDKIEYDMITLQQFVSDGKFESDLKIYISDVETIKSGSFAGGAWLPYNGVTLIVTVSTLMMSNLILPLVTENSIAFNAEVTEIKTLKIEKFHRKQSKYSPLFLWDGFSKETEKKDKIRLSVAYSKGIVKVLKQYSN